jgi:hypothetical protein
VTWFFLDAEHDLTTPMLGLARPYALAMKQAGIAPVAFSVAGMTADEEPGGFEALERRVAAGKVLDQGFLLFRAADQTQLRFMRRRESDPWEIEGTRPDNRGSKLADLSVLLAIAHRVVDAPGLQKLAVRRDPPPVPYPLAPPLARSTHLVAVRAADVEAAYEDPAPFWKAWDRVERRGDLHLCVRAERDVDEQHWLGRTFEDSMAMARAARPKKTVFTRVPPRPELAPWWEYGDPQDEKAGWPVLEPVGYNATTRTLEYAGFVPPGRHVLAREIYEIRGLLRAKKDNQGRAIDTIRVVFADLAMARAERRPLRDVGARVYAADPATGELVEVDD